MTTRSQSYNEEYIKNEIERLGILISEIQEARLATIRDNAVSASIMGKSFTRIGLTTLDRMERTARMRRNEYIARQSGSSFILGHVVGINNEN